MIIYSKEKKKGFRGFEYTAKGYIDSQGNPITEDTKEGTDMVEIVCTLTSTKKEEEVLDTLKQHVLTKIEEYKPIYTK